MTDLVSTAIANDNKDCTMAKRHAIFYQYSYSRIDFLAHYNSLAKPEAGCSDDAHNPFCCRAGSLETPPGLIMKRIRARVDDLTRSFDSDLEKGSSASRKGDRSPLSRSNGVMERDRNMTDEEFRSKFLTEIASDEILMAIFQKLDPQSLARCAQVCKR